MPVSALIGIQLGGYWSYTTVFYAFGLIPIWEAFLSPNPDQLNDQKIERRLANRFFDLMLYFNLVIVYSILSYGIWYLTTTPLKISEIIGLVLSFGIVLGTNGINVAHELGHRKTPWERLLAKILLIPALYMHFYIEHNFGHHINVATPDDGATAKYRQSVYSFWITSVTKQYVDAWKKQIELLKIKKTKFFSIKNDMLWYHIIQPTYLLFVLLLFSTKVLLFAVVVGIIAFLFLECINYIEHYGLRRFKNESGRYERVQTYHSWNSNHNIGRIVLYELTRHSDHHFKSSKKYQLLNYYEESPQLPYGYPASILLSLVPPLWFYMMDPLVPEKMKKV